MKRKVKPTLSWNNAPDTIGVEELMKLLGVGEPKATEILSQKDFPRLPNAGLKADKEAARLYLQGFRIKENQKNAIDYLILLELKKITKERKKGDEENEIIYEEKVY